MAGKSLQSIAALLVEIGNRRAGAAAGAAVVVIIRVHSNPLGLGFRVQPTAQFVLSTHYQCHTH